jgi:hypothetical protein
VPYINAPIPLRAGTVPIADLADPGTGKVVGSVANAAAAVFPPGFEIGYTQITSNANITDTAEATATALISPGALTFDGAPVLVEFFTPSLVCDTAAATDLVTVTLFEGATQITRLGVAKAIATAATDVNACLLHFRFTPSAASHTYKLCAFATSATGTPTITAGAGGTNGYAPAYIRFTKV